MKLKEIKRKYEKYLNVVYPLIGVGLFLLIWYLVSLSIGIEMILPSPSEAIKRLFVLLGTANFWVAVSNTLSRAVISFLISVVLGPFLAIIAYVLPIVGKCLNPIIVILRAVPTMSIILLALIWMSSKTAPVLISFLILFPQFYALFLSALGGVNKELIDMSKAFKVPLKRRIGKLYIPTVLPQALDAMKANVSLGIKVTIAGEVLAQTALSMGVNMQISKMYFDTAELLGWTIMAILLSYLAECVFALIKFFVVRYKR